MIYSNLKLVTPGRQGAIKDYLFNPPAPAPKSKGKSKAKDPELPHESEHQQDPSTLLGEIDGRVYRHFPDDYDISLSGPQDPDIDFRKETSISNETILRLRAQTTASFLKQQARLSIEHSIGDPLDQMSLMGQLVEFAVFGVCALMADKSGASPMDPETVKAYGERGAAVLKAAAEGQLTLRSSFEAPEKMITEILPQYSRLQQIVRDMYINPCKELDLATR